MKFCRKPFEQVYVREKYVKTCPWMDITIGSLLEKPLEELWHSERAEEARKSIRDGNFRYCNQETCPWCASGLLEEIDDEAGKCYQAQDYPTNMNISYDMVCNHACPSCRREIFVPSEEYKENMNTLKKAILPYANKTEYLTTCGQGDCFSSPYIMELLRELEPENPKFHISFETNGVFIDEEHWNEIEHLHRFPINFTITPNSFEKWTYCYLAGGIDDLEKCKRSIKFVSELRKTGKIESFKLNMVVQESNYCEIPAFIKFCLDEYNPDLIQIKPLNRWFCLDAEGYWFKNVLNPLHPYHKNYLKVMEDPILKHPKVWDWTLENHDRDPRLHPAAYEEKYIEFMRTLYKKENKELIEARLKQIGCKRVAIYGAWKYGEICYEILSEFSAVEIVGFIDKRKGGINCKGYKVQRLYQNSFEGIDTILVSNLGAYDEIVRDLRKEGYCQKIITIENLMD